MINVENGSQGQEGAVLNGGQFRDRVLRMSDQTRQRFETEREGLYPLAEQRLQRTIAPWLRHVERSGLLQELSRQSVGLGQAITLNEGIIYPAGIDLWQGGFKALEESHYEGDADRIRSYLETQARNEYLGEAVLAIGGNRARGLRLERSPLAGASFSAKFGGENPTVFLNGENQEDLLTAVHPEIVIVLAEQIEGHKINKRITSTLSGELNQGRLDQRNPNERQRVEDYFAAKQGRYAGYLRK